MTRHPITAAVAATLTHIEHGISKHGNFGSEATGCAALEDRWNKLLSAMRSTHDIYAPERATRRAMQMAALCMKYVSEFGCEVLPLWSEPRPGDTLDPSKPLDGKESRPSQNSTNLPSGTSPGEAITNEGNSAPE